MKNRNFLIILSIFLLFFMVGCSNQTADNNVTEEPTVDKVHVSFKSIKEENNENSTMAVKEDLQIFDPSIYAEPYNTYKTDKQQAELGERVLTATPEKFVTGIAEIRLSKPEGNLPLMNNNFVHTTDTSGFNIVPLLDIVHSKNIINNKALFQNGNIDFEEIELTIGAKNFMFIPKSSWDGEDAPNIDSTFETYSEIHVKLPDEYNNITFDKEIINPKYEPDSSNIHVFSLMDLLPLDKSGGNPNSVRFYFDKKINKPRIYNPTGKRVEGFNPNLWESDRGTSWKGYFVYMPGKDLNFTSGNKEITFVWNIEDLIEVYDNNTPDTYEDDHITVSLDNPFPISFEVANYSKPEYSSENPEEVKYLEGKFFDEYVKDKQIILRWINPSQESFEKIHIVKKESKFPKNIEDGKKVYEDTFPVFFDKNIEENKTYYYRIFVENSSGDISNGKEISVVSN
mgnify:CR=1 FL=1